MDNLVIPQNIGPMDWESYWNNNADWSGTSFFSQLFEPGQQQEKEWSQQMISTMYQNAFNAQQADPSYRMKQMRKAGISAAAAAAGIAGSNAVGSGSVSSSPPSSVGSGAKSAETIANAAIGAANALTGGAASLANAAYQSGILNSSIENLSAQARDLLANAGFTEVQRIGFETDNFYRDAHHVADLNIKVQNLDNMKAQWSMIEKQRDYVQKELDWYDKQIQSTLDLNSARELESKKHAFELEQSAKSIQLENDFFVANGFHSDSNVDISLRNIWLKCSETGDYEPYIKATEAAYSYYQNMHYNIARGQNEADIQAAFDKFYNQTLGSERARSEYASIFAKIENNKELFKQLSELFFASNGSPIAIQRFISLLGAQFGLSKDEKLSLEKMIHDALSVN